MDDEANDIHHNHHISPLLQALTNATKVLQVNPIYTLLYPTDPRPAIEALLKLGSEAEAETVVSSDPSLSKLSKSLSDLKTLSEKLEKLQGYNFRALFYRQVTKYEISQTARSIEAHIQSFADRKVIENLVTALGSYPSSEGGGDRDREREAEEALAEFRGRVSSRGFDRDLQELILRGRVFPALELALSAESIGGRVRDEAALAVLALAEFNRDVFVGLALMGPTVKALVSISSLSSIRVLRSLVGLIGAPLLDWIGGDREARVLVSLLSSKDIALGLAAMDVILEMASLGPKEVVEAMVAGREGLVARLMELQRRMESGDFGAGAGAEAAVKRSLARGSCVARLAASVEVGEGMERTERREIRSEILRLVGECSVSEEEFVTIVAEVLWG